MTVTPTPAAIIRGGGGRHHVVLPSKHLPSSSSSSSSTKSYSSIVKARASKGNTKVIRPSFKKAAAKAPKPKAKSLKKKKNKPKKVLHSSLPSSTSFSSSSSFPTSPKMSPQLQKLVEASGSLPDKRKNMAKMKGKKKNNKGKEPTVIKVCICQRLISKAILFPPPFSAVFHYQLQAH